MRLGAALAVVVLVATACGGGSTPAPSDVAAPTVEPTPVAADEPIEEAQPPLTDPALVAEFDEILGEAADRLLACPDQTTAADPGTGGRGVTDDTISIAFLEADLTTLTALGLAVPLGPEGEHFRAFMDDLNDRCGGVNGRRIEVNVYTFDPINPAAQREACTRSTVEYENLLVLARVVIQDGPLCIVEANESVLVSLTRLPQEFFDRSEGRLFTLDIELTRGVRLQLRDMLATGILNADTKLGVVWGDEIDQNLVVSEGVDPVLEEAGIDYVQVQLGQEGIACVGYQSAVEQFRAADVDMVFGTLSPLCYPPLVGEAAAQGYFPQYVITEYAGNTTLVGAKAHEVNGDAFEGALAHSPVVPEIGSRGLAETPVFDLACNETVRRLLGSSSAPGSSEFGGIVELCSASYAIYEALLAAGPALDQDAFVTALESVDPLPLRNGVAGSFAPDRHYASPDVMHTLLWQADCACWALEDGPRRVLDPGG